MGEDVMILEEITGVLQPPIADVPAESQQSTSADVLSTPLNSLSVTDFLLLLILVLCCINLLLKLFTRKWGFPEW